MFARMNKDSRQTIKSIISLVYFMRGSVSYNDMMFMTHAEREMIKEFLDERLEAESKNPHPVY